MKELGSTLILVGLVGVGFWLLIGAIDILILASVSIVVGVILFVSSELKQPSFGTKCPECNGLLDGTPRLCRHCRTELRWVHGQAYTPERAWIIAEQIKEDQQRNQEEFRRREIERQELRRRRQAALGHFADLLKLNLKSTSKAITSAIQRAGPEIAYRFRRFNAGLTTRIGEDKEMQLRVVQFALYVALPISAVVLIVSMWAR